VGARHTLDERRLPGAVVTDEGHHLAVPHLEVHVRQRLDGSEGLRDLAKLEKWGLAHHCAFRTRKPVEALGVSAST
jgi:hypothetical protein